MKTFCLACNCECELITMQGSDPDEFWGVPCHRLWSEEVSECCRAEFELDDEEIENANN